MWDKFVFVPIVFVPIVFVPMLLTLPAAVRVDVLSVAVASGDLWQSGFSNGNNMAHALFLVCKATARLLSCEAFWRCG